MSLFAQIMAVLTMLITAGSGVVTQIIGFKRISESFDQKLVKLAASFDDKLAKAVGAIHENMRTKFDELAEENTKLAIRLAENEREVKVLSDLLTMVLKREN